MLLGCKTTNNHKASFCCLHKFVPLSSSEGRLVVEILYKTFSTEGHVAQWGAKNNIWPETAVTGRVGGANRLLTKTVFDCRSCGAFMSEISHPHADCLTTNLTMRLKIAYQIGSGRIVAQCQTGLRRTWLCVRMYGHVYMLILVHIICWQYGSGYRILWWYCIHMLYINIFTTM